MLEFEEARRILRDEIAESVTDNKGRRFVHTELNVPIVSELYDWWRINNQLDILDRTFFRSGRLVVSSFPIGLSVKDRLVGSCRMRLYVQEFVQTRLTMVNQLLLPPAGDCWVLTHPYQEKGVSKRSAGLEDLAAWEAFLSRGTVYAFKGELSVKGFLRSLGP